MVLHCQILSGHAHQPVLWVTNKIKNEIIQITEQERGGKLEPGFQNGRVDQPQQPWLLGPHLVSLWPQRDTDQLRAPTRLSAKHLTDQRQPCSFLGGLSSVEVSLCLTSCLCPKVIGRTLIRQGQFLWVLTKCCQGSFRRGSATSRAWNSPWVPAATPAKLLITWRLHGSSGCLLPVCLDSLAGL